MAKTTASNASNKKTAQSASTQSTSAPSSGAIEALKQDHRKVDGLFEQFEQSDDDQEKERLARQICSELIIHTRLEEEIFYPACRAAGVEDDSLDEAQVEHDGVKLFVNDLLECGANTPFWDAKVSVLSEMVKHHVEEEEKPGEGTFAKAREHGIDDAGLGERLQRRKEQLQGRAAGERPIRVISIHPTSQEEGMPRYNTPERDEYGRFMSDDDRDYGRRGYRRDDDYRGGRGGRGHGGWYGDSEGHSEAARERWGERRYGSRYEDDDDGYRRGGRGHGGWYGDPEGHSEAARERWGESRRGSRYEDDGDDYRRGGRGHGGWYGDPEGHSEAARERWGEGRRSSRYDDDDDDYRRGGRGHGGWFGDSRGHAEASREGWRHRR